MTPEEKQELKDRAIMIAIVALVYAIGIAAYIKWGE